MALMLECICSPDASICTLTQILYTVSSTVASVGSIGALTVLSLRDSDGVFVELFNPTGLYTFDLALSRAIANFGSLEVTTNALI